MLRSRFWIPYQNQRIAERRYALHETTETPAAWWPIHIVRTCGIVMSMVKTDMPPNTRRRAVSEREASPAGVVGSGAMIAFRGSESAGTNATPGSHPRNLAAAGL